MLGVQITDFSILFQIMAINETTDLKGTRIEKSKNVRAKNWFIKLFGSNSQSICMANLQRYFTKFENI